ncbi:lipid A deacylase LpxR family protein [Bacteroidetes bacterium endosymbiont of Geopemphigus sp.]|uniref:lipid A deacylase LpxR family protein n=1 Tax=Bacteroidetes bacterium endosymbiont of Geopemphigus sp. TaxID=2047937 RepID=UPI0018A7FB74|nr:lipid A deacylase LpxR family protein [Bacteroidetes bacterium endosymbiont of Geopemphigus sp.]
MIFGCFSQLFAQKKIRLYEFELRTDNDSYLWKYSDRYYTNGFFLAFRYTLDHKNLKSSSIVKKILAFEIGQRLYTPQSGAIPAQKYVDRPFTAYLYAQTSISIFYKDEAFVKYSSEVGAIGPDALGEEVQSSFHRFFQFYDVNGWKYQLKSEWGLNLSAACTKLIFRKKLVDFAAVGVLNLGTTFSGADLACLIRVGWLSPLYNSLINASRIGYFNSLEVSPGKQEFYFFVKPILKYVAYDATIQGGLFRKDKGPVVFEAKPFVFSQNYGLGSSYGPWTFEVTMVFNTKELESWAKKHQWGSFRIGYAF